jgi:pseudoazurin
MYAMSVTIDSKPIAATAITLTLALIAAQPAAAADYEIKMLNKGPDHMMQFDPELLKVAPGDTVHFVATDKGHTAQSIPDMIPEGAEPFGSEMGQDLTVTLKTEGVYGYSCQPHGSMGMVGLIVVGHPTNEEAVKNVSVPGMARHEFTKLFQALDARLASGN